MNQQPAIVVIGFNRPNSIQRLLNSISRARFPSDNDVTLIISIDFSDTEKGRETKLVAENFEWNHGPKKLVFHDSNLGLRKHVLTCGDLTVEYGSIIMLEDDLTVGSEFFRYSKAALEFVAEDDQVGGISLYNHRTNFICRLPFEPVFDGGENYYLQIASSWGQAWTAKQWTGFRKWYASLNENDLKTIPATTNMPSRIANWPSSSWLKYFIWYLVASEKFFLFPRFSHSTNHSDTGTHVGTGTVAWQVPLSMRQKEFNFLTLGQSLAVYDSYFELLPSRMKEISTEFQGLDLTIDLYGTKNLQQIKSEYLLSSKPSNQVTKSYDLTKKPLEANFYSESSAGPGTFTLSKTSSFVPGARTKLSYKLFNVFEYFHGYVPLKKVIANILRYIIQRKHK